MTKKLTPAIDLFLPSSRIIYRNLLTFFVLLVVPLLLSSMTGTMPELPSNPSFSDFLAALRDNASPYAMLGGLLTLIFLAPLTYAELQTSASKEVALDEAFTKGFKFFWRLLGLSILSGLLIVLGFIAFIIPGFIMIRRYVLAPYFLIDKNMGIREAMSRAANATKPVSMSIYSIFAVFILFAFVSVLGPVGLVVGTILQVLYSLAFALRYQEIKNN